MPESAHATNPMNVPDLRERANGEFIHVGEVAQIVGQTDRHLRRQCAEKLVGIGLARLIDNKWHIHRSFDPRLAHTQQQDAIAESSESAAERLKHYPEAKVIAAGHKATAIERYRALKADPRVTMKIAVPSLIAELRKRPGVRVSYRTLRLWDNEAPRTTDRAELIEHFIDKRGGDQRGQSPDTRCSVDAWKYFCALYLRSGRRLSMKHCWELTQAVAEEHGWSWLTYSGCKYKVRTEISTSVKTYGRHGEQQWDRQFGARMQQAPDAWSAGEMWVGDHTQLDFFARNDRTGKPDRLWATTWTDWRTRKIVGWWLDWTPSADTIRLAMHRAIEAEGGPPKRVTIDHGKDYESHANIGMTKAEKRRITASGDDWREHVEGIFGLLGIETHFSIEYNPDGKSRAERWYGTLHTRFCRTFESWCGSKPGEVDLPKWIFKSPERLPSIDDVRASFAEFVQWYNARSDHEIDDLVDERHVKLSPAEAMTAWKAERVVMANADALPHLLARWERPVAVNRKLGVGITVAGRKVYFGSGNPALEPYKGAKQRVRVAYDPERMDRIHVFTLDWRFITIAERNRMYGGSDPASREIIAEGMKLKREHRRAVRKSVELAHTAYLDPVTAGLEAQRRREEERLRERAQGGTSPSAPDASEQSTRLVQTPVDDQLKAIQQAEFRQAAGGEFSEYTGDAGDNDDELDIGDLSDLTPFAFNNTSQPNADEDDDDDDLDLEAFTLASMNHDHSNTDDDGDDDGDEIHPLDELSPFTGQGGPGGLIE